MVILEWTTGGNSWKAPCMGPTRGKALEGTHWWFLSGLKPPAGHPLVGNPGWNHIVGNRWWKPSGWDPPKGTSRGHTGRNPLDGARGDYHL